MTQKVKCPTGLQPPIVSQQSSLSEPVLCSPATGLLLVSSIVRSRQGPLPIHLIHIKDSPLLGESVGKGRRPDRGRPESNHQPEKSRGCVSEHRW